jgi:hypothetical protein
MYTGHGGQLLARAGRNWPLRARTVVRLGSLADISSQIVEVGFTPESGHTSSAGDAH